MTTLLDQLFEAHSTFMQDADTLTVYGWLAHPRQEVTHISVYLNAICVTEKCDLYIREDVPPVLFRYDPPAIRSDFVVTVPIAPFIPLPPISTITLVGFQNSREIGKTTIAVRDFERLPSLLPQPPRDMQVRVGQQDPDFLERGWRIYDDLKKRLEKFRPITQFERVLDWGCGCGRVTRFFMEELSSTRVFGCDIDAESIEWDTHQLNPWTFTHVPAHPPTPYPDKYFDLIYGTSVFTHLDQQTQFQWLAELHRILRPDGIVAVSVLDQAQVPIELEAALSQTGFIDLPSADRAIFAPYSDPEYYRVSYHTREYIAKNWSQFFDLLDYGKMAINVHQSLVLLRRKPGT